MAERRGHRARRWGRFRATAIGLATVLGAAGTGLTPAEAVWAAAPAAGSPHRHQVTTTMTAPITASQAAQLAFDLDGGPAHTKDNRLGKVLAVMANQGIDVQSTITQGVVDGTVVTLHALQADSLVTDATARWRVFTGKPKADPVLTGGGRFTVDRNAASGTWLPGRIRDRTFTGGPGIVQVRLQLAPGIAPARFRLVGARIKARCTKTGCTNGVLGGAIRAGQIDTVLLPAFVAWFQAVIGPTCSAVDPDACSDEADHILALFDADDDHVITTDELSDSPLLGALLSPDVDLFKANGKPGHDGVADSLSVGLGFTTTTAVFTEPG